MLKTLNEKLNSSKTPLADIKTLLQERHDAYKTLQIALNPVIFYGKIISNEFGFVCLVDKIKPETIENDTSTPVVDYELYRQKLREQTGFEYFSQTFINFQNLPTEKDNCIHCGKGFSIQELDSVQYLSNGQLSHLSCHIEDLDAKHRYKFTEALVKAGFKVNGLIELNNMYGSLNYRGHWFLAGTDLGFITIGYRKRVIDVKFDKKIEINDGKDTTTYEGGFHAYDFIELGNRLALLKTHLVKS